MPGVLRRLSPPAERDQEQWSESPLSADQLAVLAETADPRSSFNGYERTLTAHGGLAITYRGQLANTFLDIVRAGVFGGATIWGAREIFWKSDLIWPTSVLVFLAGAAIAWIVAYWKIYVRHRLEVHPEGLLVDDKYFFSIEDMGDNRPMVQLIDSIERDRFEVVGIVGTRAIRFATVARTDKNDRTAERLQQDLQMAMEQLWDRRHALVPVDQV